MISAYVSSACFVVSLFLFVLVSSTALRRLASSYARLRTIRRQVLVESRPRAVRPVRLQSKKFGELSCIVLWLIVMIVIAVFPSLFGFPFRVQFRQWVPALDIGSFLFLSVAWMFVYVWVSMIGELVFYVNSRTVWLGAVPILTALLYVTLSSVLVLAPFLFGVSISGAAHGVGGAVLFSITFIGLYASLGLWSTIVRYRPHFPSSVLADHGILLSNVENQRELGTLERHFITACYSKRTLLALLSLLVLFLVKVRSKRHRKGFWLTFLHHLGWHSTVIRIVTPDAVERDASRLTMSKGELDGRTRLAVILSLAALKRFAEAEHLLRAEIDHLSRSRETVEKKEPIVRKLAHANLALAYLVRIKHGPAEAIAPLEAVLSDYPKCTLALAWKANALQRLHGSGEIQRARLLEARRRLAEDGSEFVDPSVLYCIGTTGIMLAESVEALVKSVRVLACNVYCFNHQESKLLLSWFLLVNSRKMESAQLLLEEIVAQAQAGTGTMHSASSLLVQIWKARKEGSLHAGRANEFLLPCAATMPALSMAMQSEEYYVLLRKEIVRLYSPSLASWHTRVERAVADAMPKFALAPAA